MNPHQIDTPEALARLYPNAPAPASIAKAIDQQAVAQSLARVEQDIFAKI